MAWASKAEQRLKASTNYTGAASELSNTSYRKAGDMGKSKDLLAGTLSSGSNTAIYGVQQKASGSSGLAGNMSAKGYTDGPKWKRAMEPGNLQPGKRSQAGNTTRMSMGKGDKEPVMKVTSKTPKELRGGRGR